MTEIDLKIKNQKDIVKESIYNVKGRTEAVIKKINASTEISEANKQFIFKFCDHCSLQGLSNQSSLLPESILEYHQIHKERLQQNE